LVNWYGNTTNTAAASCWGGGVTCANRTIPTGCPSWPFDPTCPTSVVITVCEPANGRPAWSSCSVDAQQGCNLGEYCTC
jgi:hypothetical protein